MIGKKHQPDFVVVADGAEGDHAGDFRREFALGEIHAAKRARSAHIHDQHDGQLAFLGEFLHVGMPEPRGHVPVDGAHFVAGLVFANLLKVHAPAFEHATVLAREGSFHKPARLQLQPPYFR